MWKAQHKTNRKLWLACSAIIYLLFMCVFPLEGKLGGWPVGVIWFALITEANSWHTSEFFFFVVVELLLVFGGVSLLLGWIAQAVCVIALPRRD